MFSIKSLIKRYTNDTLSILIVPHTGKGIKQIKFKKFVLYTFVSVICLVCISLGVLLYILHDLNIELDSKVKNIARLQSSNVQQVQEIYELKTKAVEVNEKLLALNDLETQVRDLVGLKNAPESDIPVTRSLMRQDYKDILSNLTDSEDLLKEDEDHIEVLAAQMDSELENLNVLLEEVTGQLKLLDAKPTNRPVQGRITSKYGYRKSPFTGRTQFHKGIDIANSMGTDIEAAGSGVVTFAGWNSGYGRTIIISHGYGYRTVYAHNNKLLVEVGQKVSKGDIIAELGSSGRSTGPHVHFEIHYQGKQIDPTTILEN